MYSQSRNKTIKILVADDNVDILEAMKLMLELEGYQVVTTGNEHTISAIQSEMPHLILLDIWMNGVDGRQVCRQLKSDDILRSIPVILVSASHGLKESMDEASADGYLSKPFDMIDLLEKVREYTNHL